MMTTAKRAILTAILLSAAPLAAQSKIQPAAPIPTQIATAHSIFLSNAIDWDYAYSARDYNALYAALKSWGKYDLAATPADADLIFEMLYVTNPGGCVVTNGNGGSSTWTTLTLHILDRATRTVLWSVNEYPGGAGYKEATRERSSAAAATAIVNDLKVLSEPDATAGEAKDVPPTPTKPSTTQKKH
jgi:hypothetical protein